MSQELEFFSQRKTGETQAGVQRWKADEHDGEKKSSSGAQSGVPEVRLRGLGTCRISTTPSSSVPAKVLSAQLLLVVTIFLLLICPGARPGGLFPSLICVGSFTLLTTNTWLPYSESIAVASHFAPRLSLTSPFDYLMERPNSTLL